MITSFLVTAALGVGGPDLSLGALLPWIGQEQETKGKDGKNKGREREGAKRPNRGGGRKEGPDADARRPGKDGEAKTGRGQGARAGRAGRTNEDSAQPPPVEERRKLGGPTAGQRRGRAGQGSPPGVESSSGATGNAPRSGRRARGNRQPARDPATGSARPEGTAESASRTTKQRGPAARSTPLSAGSLRAIAQDEKEHRQRLARIHRLLELARTTGRDDAAAELEDLRRIELERRKSVVAAWSQSIGDAAVKQAQQIIEASIRSRS